MNMPTNADMLNMALNAMMIAAIGGLWLMWLQVSRKQRRVEAMLLATSEQLDAALAHMEQTMAHLRRIEAARPGKETGGTSRRPEMMEQPRTTEVESKEGTTTLPGMEDADKPASSATPRTAPLTRVLRLHREGCEAEEIARREDIPLAKVRLMLKLHARQAAA